MRDKVYFVSDMHLGARYIADSHDHERIIARWLRSIAGDARELYLLGDVLDYWYEYREVVPRGYTRFFGALAELADTGVKITWLKGNHDIWIFDYLPSEIGLTAVDGILDTTIDGKRFVMEHGDGVGELRPSYRRMHRLFRSRFCQWLFAAIHPRWTVAFAHRWSSSSRTKGYSPEATDRAVERLVCFATDYSRENGKVDNFIFGHIHTPRQVRLDTGATLTVLGDAYSQMSYAVWDGSSVRLETMSH